MAAVLRILLVDDNMALRATLARLLDSPEFEIVGAVGDGCAAVQAARQLLPDIVLMDYQMPLMDGLAASRLILAGPEPPVVILLSGEAGPDLQTQAQRLGVRTVLQKGGSLQMVREALLRARSVAPTPAALML